MVASLSEKGKDCSDSLIVLMHSEHFYSGLDTSELISSPPISNIIFNRMTVVTMRGNCQTVKRAESAVKANGVSAA